MAGQLQTGPQQQAKSELILRGTFEIYRGRKASQKCTVNFVCLGINGINASTSSGISMLTVLIAGVYMDRSGAAEQNGHVKQACSMCVEQDWPKAYYPLLSSCE